jgi:hypothetical protein
MTKEQFRALITNAIDTIMSMPDDLWESGYPMLRINIKGSNERIVAGIEEMVEDDC